MGTYWTHDKYTYLDDNNEKQSHSDDTGTYFIKCPDYTRADTFLPVVDNETCVRENDLNDVRFKQPYNCYLYKKKHLLNYERLGKIKQIKKRQPIDDPNNNGKVKYSPCKYTYLDDLDKPHTIDDYYPGTYFIKCPDCTSSTKVHAESGGKRRSKRRKKRKNKSNNRKKHVVSPTYIFLLFADTFPVNQQP
jgi:hypothetical protein